MPAFVDALAVGAHTGMAVGTRIVGEVVASAERCCSIPELPF